MQKLSVFLAQERFLPRVAFKERTVQKLRFKHELLHNHYILTHLLQLMNRRQPLREIVGIRLSHTFSQYFKRLTTFDSRFEDRSRYAYSDHLLIDLLILSLVEFSSTGKPQIFIISPLITDLVYSCKKLVCFDFVGFIIDSQTLYFPFVIFEMSD
jgi:hypothetical protein